MGYQFVECKVGINFSSGLLVGDPQFRVNLGCTFGFIFIQFCCHSAPGSQKSGSAHHYSYTWVGGWYVPLSECTSLRKVLSNSDVKFIRGEGRRGPLSCGFQFFCNLGNIILSRSVLMRFFGTIVAWWSRVNLLKCVKWV